MGIGAQIKKYRLQVGWTLERLSEASGVEIGTIGALEARDSSRSKFFPAIAKALGMTVEQLADESINMSFTIVNDIVFAKPPKGFVAAEAQAPYLWPFKDLKPHEWELLTEDERQHIENGALMLIRARADPKQAAPAKTIASA